MEKRHGPSILIVAHHPYFTQVPYLLTLDHCLKHCFTITAHTLKPRPFISKRRHLLTNSITGLKTSKVNKLITTHNANRVSFVWSQVTKQPFVNTLEHRHFKS